MTRQLYLQPVTLLMLVLTSLVCFGQALEKPKEGPIIVFGNVARPRPLVASEVGLLRAIELMGGVKHKGAVRIRIFRDIARRRNPIVIDLESVIRGWQDEPLLKAGDIVEVSDADGRFSSPLPFMPQHPTWDPPLIKRKPLDC